MKKTVILLLVLALILLPACENPPKVSVWDGSVAEGFGAGEGSAEKPYEIASAAEFAYLAQAVNAGNDYTGRYFVLQCDVDLAGIEWAPVGNGVSSFSGHFDGGGHTIRGLKVTEGHLYEYEYTEGKFIYYRLMGLFGSCSGATVQNLSLQAPKLSYINEETRSVLLMGALVGEIKTDGENVIEGITVENGELYMKSLGDGTFGAATGGAVGMLYAYEGSAVTVRDLQIEAALTVGRKMNAGVGGLIGRAASFGDFICENATCKLTVDLPDDEDYISGLYIAAFGYTQAMDSSFRLANIFSEIEMKDLWGLYRFVPNYTAYAMIGAVYGNGVYELEELSGYVRQSEGGEEVTELDLYDIPERVSYTEENCAGGTTLCS